MKKGKPWIAVVMVAMGWVLWENRYPKSWEFVDGFESKKECARVRREAVQYYTEKKNMKSKAYLPIIEGYAVRLFSKDGQNLIMTLYCFPSDFDPRK